MTMINRKPYTLRMLTFAGAMLCCSGAAIAGELWHQVRTTPATPVPGQPFLIEVNGTWPNGCPFSVSPVTLQGQKLSLRLSSQPAICTEALRPYQLSVDPAPTLPRGLAAGTYELWVEVEDAQGVRPISFSLLSVRGTDTVVNPEPGFWVADRSGRYADSGSGVGFNLERQDDAMAMIAYFYSTDGEPRWYFSAGDAERTSYGGDLLEIRGGQALFRPYQAPRDMQSFGRIDLAFSDRGHAEAWFSQPIDGGILSAIEVMPISLVRFGFKAGATAPSMSGRWVIVSLARDGGSGTVIDLQADASADPFQLRLVDQRAAVSLDCGIIVENLDQPPTLCMLTSDLGSIVLDDNGLDELRSGDGSTRLIKLDP